MPSILELVYAALLYSGESPANPPSTNFVQGTATENAGETKLNFSFQRPEETSGLTLEIFAFVKTEGESEDDTMQFSREAALLSGNKTGLSIVGDTIEISEAIPLSSSKPGTVSLKIKVPDECSLVIDDARFSVMGDSLDFTLTQNGDGISAGAYQVTFTVKKDDEIVHIFSEYINVFPGMRTDTWSGLEKDAAKEITQSMISSTVYVRGEGGWYDGSDYKNTATASDSNSGSFLSPFASIQKAVDKIIAINDGVSEYTIYVDGKFTAASSAALADFSGVSKHLSVKIAGLDPSSLDESKKAVIDGNGSARGIVVGASDVKKDVNLALENLVIQNTNTSDRGGGITLYCTAGNSHTIKNCVIKNNHAGYGSAIYNEYGSLDLQGCVISGNTADTSGTVYIGRESAILTMSDVRIENNSAGNGGGIFLAYDSTAKISDSSVVIRNNSGSSSVSQGVGICLWNGRLELSGSAKIDDVVEFPNERDSITHEVVVAGDLTATTPVATITPSSYSAGEKVLSANDATTIQNICDKFAITPQDDGTEWKIAPDGANGVLMPDSALYVSSGGDDTAGDGTKAKPFATLQKAFDTIKDRNDSTASYTIRISGTVVGGCEISGTSAANVLITGTSADTDILDGGGATEVFKTFSALSIEIKNVKITNGSYGISVNNNNAIVTLGSGAEVSATHTSACVPFGTFILDGGAISGGEGRYPVDFMGKKFIMKSGTIIGGALSGCVFINDSDGEFIMEGGTISGGTAKLYGGGGVLINSGTFTMRGGTISGCQSTTTNTSYGGGGVYVKGSDSYFTMSGGEITGNTATTSGGGVYVNNSGTFTMEGGTINGNTATNGNGAYLAAKGKLNMSGEAQFAESDDVYLYANGTDIPTVCVVGDLNSSSPVVATITPSDYTAGRQVLSAGTDMTIDDTVCDKFALTPAPDGMEWKIVPNDDGTAGALGIESVFLDSSSGDDANSGLTASKAVKTLSKAIELFDSQYAQKIMVCAAYTLPSGESNLLDRMGGG